MAAGGVLPVNALSFPAFLIAWEAIGSIAGVLAVLVALLQWWLSRRPAPSSADLAVERNYLLELLPYLERYQPAPLRMRNGEHIAASAEIRPSFNILSVKDRMTQRPKGKTTQNLVRKLLRSKAPYVVLGGPGSGKSVALRRVAASIAERGQKDRVPRLPVYVRLGGFTASPDRANAFPEFIIETIRATGPAGARVADRFAQYRQEGRFVFILDGLDEMPRRDYGARFQAVVAEVRTFSDTNLYVLACRTYDFREAFAATQAEIQPFSDRQIQAFLKRSLGVANGKRTAAAISRVGGAAADMAANPFFLKLIAAYVAAGNGALPASRAEVMRGFEDVLLHGAEPALADDTRLALARLAFLITSGSRGVTFPEGELSVRFAEDFAAGQITPERLQAALAQAVERNVLIAEPGHGGARVLCFSHHRLQEYYTAQYLYRFQPPVDWTRAFEDIWWRETIIMLCGIVPDSGAVMDPVLARVPERPLVFPALAEVTVQILEALPKSRPLPEETWQRLRDLDPTGAYGLPHPSAAEDSLPRLREWLASIFGPEVRLARPAAALKSEGAEPNANPDAEALRNWLEPRQQAVLDAAELAVDCVRNSRASPSLDLLGVSRALAALVADGNDGERVRATEILARIPDFDGLYEALQPALTGPSAWARREAMFALMESHVGFRARQQDLPFLLFLQFLKGETLPALPKYMRACRANPRLLRIAPVLSILALWSVAAALIPAAIPAFAALLYRPLAHWIWIPAAPVAAYLYYRRLKFSRPVLFPALQLVCLTAIPALATTVYAWFPRADDGVAKWTAAAASVGLVLAPTLLLNVLTFLPAATAVAASRSRTPLRAWLLYSRENWRLTPFQQAISGLAGIILAIVAFAVIVSATITAIIALIFEAGAFLVHRFAAARPIFEGIGVLIGLCVLWALWPRIRNARLDPAAAAGKAIRGALKGVAWFALFVLGMFALALIVVLAMGGYSVTAPVLEAHASQIWVGLVAVVAGVCLVFLVRPWIGTFFPREDDEDYALLTPAERLEYDRQMISRCTSRWERSYYHRRILRSYKALRQDRAGSGVPPARP